jgi:fucose permease
LGLPDALLGSAWPAIHGAAGVPLGYAAFISLFLSGGTVVSSLLSNVVIRRFGTGRVTVFSILLTSASLAVFSMSHNFVLFCLCAIPLGMGAGAIDSGLNGYVALHYRALHMNWLHCFWGVGASIGPLIISAFLTRAPGDWFMGYRTVAAIQAGLFVIMLISLPLWKAGGETAETTAAGNGQADGGRAGGVLAMRGVKSIVLVFFCYCAVEVTAGLWSSSYLVREYGKPPEIAARWTALFYGGITAGRFAAGFFSLKFSNKLMLRLGQIVSAAALIAISLPLAVPSGGGIPAAVSALMAAAPAAGLFTLGLGCAPIFPTLMHETPRLFGAHCSQAVIGLEMSAAYLSAAISPAIFGALAERFSFKLFPAVLAAFLAINIALVEKLYAGLNEN